MPYARLRRVLLPLLLASIAGTGAGAAHAADAKGNFAIRGPGSQSCAAYLATISKPDATARYGSWLLGYVSAHNRLDADTYDLLPTEAGGDFVNMVAIVCRTNPQMSVENAANSAVRAITPLRQTVSSPIVQVQSDGKTISIHQDSLKRLQTALIAKQFFKGTATGTSSPQFVDALKAFQRKEGIAVTGLPDSDSFIRAIIKR
ncbi:peptidoglycan-binding domain-containing protein [Novosphingobium sp.]|uniref:peptidoglycan-binding domain-containing protein n=1 Tax=Novosphingobium sp. TaxID=1874826 RepID=UPI0026095227|nr:peptidoglycan-binding domain-containing protein [Novosphingobium sp.]